MQHPEYSALEIRVGGPAKAGAFYVTYTGHYLTHIAKEAYGGQTPAYINRINKSKYNMARCIYRKSSASCSSAVVSDPVFILAQPDSWAALAWVSLCAKDRGGRDGLGLSLGTPYQVIWIPPLTGEEPWDFMPEKEPEVPATPVVPPGVKVPDISGGEPVSVTVPGVSLEVNIGEGGTVNLPGITFGGGGTGTGGGGTGTDGGGGTPGDGTPTGAGDEPVTPPSPVTQKAGVPWWLGAILGLGAIGTVIYFAVKDKRKGKKRK